jgi:hypothetical protein
METVNLSVAVVSSATDPKLILLGALLVSRSAFAIGARRSRVALPIISVAARTHLRSR